MINSRVKNCIEILEYAINNNLSARAASIAHSKGENYVSNFAAILLDQKDKGIITNEECENFQITYSKYLSHVSKNPVLKVDLSQIKPIKTISNDDTVYDATTDDKYDSRSVGESIRDENNRITEYRYKILIRDSPTLEGVFTRDEMDRVYQLYSSVEGAGLTVKHVAREFPKLTFVDFKRILRAFNITKQSSAVAPHIIEEHSTEYVINYILRNKENFITKHLELEKGKHLEKSYKDIQKQLITRQSDDDWISEMVEKFVSPREPITFKKPDITNIFQAPGNGKPCICIFGDIHYGKKFDSPIYGRGYNKDIAHERIMQIGKAVISDYNRRLPSEIILICLGDLVESILEDGMHPAHTHEMDLLQDEQVFFAVESLAEMITMIRERVACPINYHVIHGNHDRIGLGRDDDRNRTAGKIISKILRRQLESDTIKFHIPENNLIRIVSGNLLIFAQHGDAALSKKKPSELINLLGAQGCYSVLLQGHWHSLNTDEGTNFITMKVPSVTSADKYIQEVLGSNKLPGFIIGHEPENCYGFNYTKVTLH